MIMCTIDWPLMSSVLTGVGTFFVGVAALFTVWIQFKQLKDARDARDAARKEAADAHNQLEADRRSTRLMLSSYREYMASSEGIVWSDYPADADMIVSRLAKKTGLDPKVVKEMLDRLKAAGKI